MLQDFTKNKRQRIASRGVHHFFSKKAIFSTPPKSSEYWRRAFLQKKSLAPSLEEEIFHRKPKKRVSKMHWSLYKVLAGGGSLPKETKKAPKGTRKKEDVAS